MTDLVEIMAQGTMRATVLHAQDRGINIDAGKVSTNLRNIIKAEWTEFMATIKDATLANMGDAMYKTIMNTYCNSWAVKAIKAS